MMCADTLYATLSKGAFILLLHLHCRTSKSTAWRKQFKPELKKTQNAGSCWDEAICQEFVRHLNICLVFFLSLSSSSCCLRSQDKGILTC